MLPHPQGCERSKSLKAEDRKINEREDLKMKEFVEFNGVVFEVKKPIDILTVRQRKGLYECYKNPSRTKESIYRYWRDYVFNTFDYVENFGVESYNVHMFTLGWTTTSGVFYITKTRHEFYPYKCD